MRGKLIVGIARQTALTLASLVVLGTAIEAANWFSIAMASRRKEAR